MDSTFRKVVALVALVVGARVVASEIPEPVIPAGVGANIHFVRIRLGKIALK